ncbi:hypothetical protein D3C86_2084880 [compost metagenome]
MIDFHPCYFFRLRQQLLKRGFQLEIHALLLQSSDRFTNIVQPFTDQLLRKRQLIVTAGITAFEQHFGSLHLYDGGSQRVSDVIMNFLSE